jgi:phage terminase large subunit-like protein
MSVRRKNETMTWAVNGIKTQENNKEIQKHEKKSGQKHKEKINQ